MQVRAAFTKVLREIRTDQGLTQEKLAFKSGLLMQTISLLECAKFQPTLETIFALTHALGVSAVNFIDEVEQLCDENI